jgi:hypothetical protein
MTTDGTSGVSSEAGGGQGAREPGSLSVQSAGLTTSSRRPGSTGTRRTGPGNTGRSVSSRARRAGSRGTRRAVSRGTRRAGSRGTRRAVSRGATVATLAAITCLVVAVAAGIASYALATRNPTAAQRAAAAATAVADRWRSWQAGRIFPATLRYSTSLLTTEEATRVGISPETRCTAAVDASVSRLAASDHCQAGLRATYLDQLQGVVYTVGVLAFPSQHLAAAFSLGVHRNAAASQALRPFAMPGTASALFSANARQAGTATPDGPFVVLTAAGYADGEPTGRGQQKRPSAFGPAAQLAVTIARQLAQPVTVDCASPAWSC